MEITPELVRVFEGKKDLTVKMVADMLGFDPEKIELSVDGDYLVFTQFGKKMEFRTAYWRQVNGRSLKLYLHTRPRYLYNLKKAPFTNLNCSKKSSPVLHDKIAEMGFVLEIVEWDGFPDSLPTYLSCLIQGSHLMRYSTSVAVAKRSHELGHFCFFADTKVKSNGDRAFNEPIAPELEKWLAQVGHLQSEIIAK